MGTISASRNDLQKAIADCESRKEDVTRAENMLHGAHEMLTKLLAKRAEFASLEDEISSARAANIKAAIIGEDAIWRDDPSGRFAERLEARDKIEEEIGAVRQTIPSLENELEDAKRAVEAARFKIEEGAERVFGKEADALAREYLDKLAEVRRMSQQLWFMAHIQVKREPQERRHNAPIYWGGEVNRQIAMTGHVASAVRENPHGDHDLRGGIALRERMSKAVAQWWQKLHSDPQAQLEMDEPPAPYDFAALSAKLKEAS
jgi:DNA repair exonuclease SbcCD ATPase subunit